MSKYYPHTSRDEKIAASKMAIIQSLDLAVHPEHLKRVKLKLDALEKFWSDDLKRNKLSERK